MRKRDDEKTTAQIGNKDKPKEQNNVQVDNQNKVKKARKPGHSEGKKFGVTAGAHGEAVVGVAAENDTTLDELTTADLYGEGSAEGAASEKSQEQKTDENKQEVSSGKEQPEQVEKDEDEDLLGGGNVQGEPLSHDDNYAQYNRYSDRPDGLIGGEASGMHTDAGNYETPFGRHEGLAAGGSDGPDAAVSGQGIQGGKVGTHGPGVQRAGPQSPGVSINPFVVGSQTGQVVEDQLVSKTADGDLAIIRGADLFSPQSVSSKYGELNVSQDGHWNFELNNQLQATQQLSATEQVEEVFNVVSKDGSSHEIHIFIHGTEDKPVITNIAAQSVSEGASLLKGQVGATDVDHGDTLSFSTSAKVAGFQLNPDGSYTFDPTDPAYNKLSEGAKNVLNIPVTVTDSQGGSTTSTLQITVTGTNDAPVMNVVPPQSAVEDGSVIHGRVTGSDVDSGDVVVYGLSRPVAGFTMHPDGSYEFDPSHIVYQNIAEGDVREIHVPVTLVDSHGAQTTSDLLIRVTGTNDIPTMLVVPSASLHEGDAVFRGQLAAMDVDSGDSMTYTSTQPVAGFQLSQDGSYTFDPTDPAYEHLAPGDSTTLKIPLMVSDGHGGTDRQILMITVNGTNDKPTVVGQPLQHVTEDGSVRGQLQATDIDDNEHFSFTMPAPVPGLTLNTDGSYTFDASAPDYQHLKQGEGLDLSIPVLATDSHGGSSVGQINIHISGTNDVPVVGGIDHAIGSVAAAGAQQGNVHVDGNLIVLDVDTDESIFQPQLIKGTYGVLAIDQSGHWSYSADASQKALVSLQGSQALPEHFEVHTADGTVHGIDIKIMGQNTAAAIGGVSTGMTKENVVGSASGKMTVTDPNQGESEFVAEDRDTLHGHFKLDANGNWEFTLNNQNPEVQALAESGMITEKIAVGSVDGTPHVVTINIVGTNDVPQIAGTASGTVTEDATTATAVGTLTGSDVDTGATQAWSIIGTDQGTYGSIAVDPNSGQWTYTLDNSLAATQQLAEGQPGHESFRVAVTDEHGAVAMKTVTLMVTGTNDAPTVSSAVTLPGGSEDIAIKLTTVQLLANAADVDQGDLAQLSVANLQADHGTITDNHDGTFTFHPDANYNGPVSFTYDVQDPHGASVSTSASMNLAAVNDAAVITGDVAGDVTEDATYRHPDGTSSATSADGFLHISDVDTGEGRFTFQHGDSDNGYGTFVLLPTGAWRYIPKYENPDVQALGEGKTLTDSFTVHSPDGTQQTINITIHGTNDAPTVSGGITLSQGTEDTAVTLTKAQLLAHASDIDHGETALLSVHNLQADHGQITDNHDGTFTFHPDADYNGAVQFTYDVQDPQGASVQATADLNLQGVNDAATLTAGLSVTEDATAGTLNSGWQNLDVQDIDGAAEQKVLKVEINGVEHTLPANFADTIAGTYGTFHFTHGTDGHDKWSYTANNSNGDIQGLKAGQSLQDHIVFITADGTRIPAQVDIRGTEDGVEIDTPASTSAPLGTVTEDTHAQAQGQLQAHDADTDDAVTWQAQTVKDAHGTFTVDASGHWTYTLDPAASQSLSANDHFAKGFDVTAVSSDGSTATRHVEVLVQGTNDAPDVTADSAPHAADLGATDVNQAMTFTESRLLQLVGASDVDGDRLHVTDVSAPHGTFAKQANGEWTFTPNANFHGDDLAVTIKVSDGHAETTAHGQLDVTATPGQLHIDSIDNALAVQHVTTGGHPVHGANHPGQSSRWQANAYEVTSGDVTIHGSATGLPDGTAVTVHLVDKLNPANSFDLHATVTGGAWSATIDHSQVDKVGTHDWSVDVSATDLFGTTVHATTEIIDEGSLKQTATEGGAATSLDLLDGADDMSVANLLFSTDGQHFSSQVPAGFKLGPDGHTLQIDPANPAFDRLAAGATETVHVKYDITETVGGQTETVHQTASVIITGTDDAATIQVLGTHTADLDPTVPDTPAGMIRATDVDSAAPTVVAIDHAQGSFGTFSVNAMGIYKYEADPDLPASKALDDGVVDQDRFTVHFTDGSTKDVVIDVTGTNDAPTVTADTGHVADLGATAEDTAKTFTEAELLKLVGAADPDQGDTLHVQSVSIDPTAGTFTKDAATGDWTFTPAANYHGTDVAVSLTVTDGHNPVTAHGTLDVTSVTDAAAPSLTITAQQAVMEFAPNSASGVVNTHPVSMGGALHALTVDMTILGGQQVATSGNHGATFLSYAVPSDSNAMYIWNPDDITFRVGGHEYPTGLAMLQDGHDHRYTFSWDGTQGTLDVLIDGQLSKHLTGVGQGATIPDGGKFALGNDQDNFGGGFSTGDAFSGKMFNVAIAKTAIDPSRLATDSVANLLHGDPDMVANIVAQNGQFVDTSGHTQVEVSGQVTVTQVEVDTAIATPNAGALLKLHLTESPSADLSDHITARAVSGFPAGTIVSDGQGHSVTVNTPVESIDITRWTTASLTAQLPSTYHGNMNIGVAITTTGPDGTAVTAVDHASVILDPSQPVPDATIAGDDQGTTPDDDTAVSGVLTVTDSDASQAHFTAQSDMAGNYGKFSIGADGHWTYTPDDRADALANGRTEHESFTVQSADGTNHQVDITVTGSNDGPSVSATPADLGATDEDTARTFTEADLLQLVGAQDADTGDVLHVDAVTVDPQFGTFSKDAATGDWTFTPAANFNGADVPLTISVTDGTDTTDAHAKLAVTAVDDALTIAADAQHPAPMPDIAVNTETTFTKAQLLQLVGAADPDGDALSISEIHIDPKAGYFAPQANGDWLFKPAANFHADDLDITLKVTDGTSTVEAHAQLDITATPGQLAITTVDNALKAGSTYETATSDLAIHGTAVGLPDGTPITVHLADKNHPENTFDLQATVTGGAWSLSFDQSKVLVDGNHDWAVTAQATDLFGTAVDATTEVVYQDTPTTSAQHGTAATSLDLLAGSVAGTVVQHVEYSTDGQHWSTQVPAGFTLAADGHTLQVDPTNAAYSTLGHSQQQQVQVRYELAQASDPSATIQQTASVTITGTNQGPTVTAVDAGHAGNLGATDEDTAKTFTEAELIHLVGGADADHDALHVSAVHISPEYGSFARDASGSWTFTPAANCDGTHLPVTVEVTDGTATATGHAQIDINPVADTPVLGISLGAVQLSAAVADPAKEVTSNSGMAAYGSTVDSDFGAGMVGGGIRLIAGDAAYVGDLKEIILNGHHYAVASIDGSAAVLDTGPPGSPNSATDAFIKAGDRGTPLIFVFKDGATHATSTTWKLQYFNRPGESGDPFVNDMASWDKPLLIDRLAGAAPTDSHFTAHIPEDATVELHITLSDPDSSEHLALVVSGLPQGATLSAGTQNADGTWSLTPDQLPGLTMTPPADFAGAIHMEVTATSTYHALTAQKVMQLDLTVDPVAETPIITSTDSPEVLEHSGAIPLDIQVDAHHDDGETLSVKIDHLPPGAVLSAGTHNADGSWTLTPAQLQGLTLTPEKDWSGGITLEVTATSTEATGETTTTVRHVTAEVRSVLDLTLSAQDVTILARDHQDDWRFNGQPLDIHLAMGSDAGERLPSGFRVDVPSGEWKLHVPGGIYMGQNHYTMTPADLAGMTIEPPIGFHGDGHFEIHGTVVDEGTHHSIDMPFTVHVQDPPAPAPQSDEVEDQMIDMATDIVADDDGSVDAASQAAAHVATDHDSGDDLTTPAPQGDVETADSQPGIAAALDPYHAFAARDDSAVAGDVPDTAAAEHGDSVSTYASIFEQAGAEMYEPGTEDSSAANLPEGLADVLAGTGADVQQVGADHALDPAAMASLLDEQSQDQDHPIDGQHQDVEHIPDDPGVDTDLDDPSLLHQEEHHS